MDKKLDTMMKQRVIVIGNSFTSRLCVARSVAPLGYDISVVIITGRKKDGTLIRKIEYDCYSRYISTVLYCHNSEDSLIQLLLDNCVDNNKAILFPTSDFAVSTIDKNHDILSKYFLFPYINHEQGAVVKWMNKERQKALAQEIGLNVAKSTTIEIKNGQYVIPDNINYPCFTKTRSYIIGTKHTLKRCDNKHELQNFVKTLCKKYECTLLVEDFKFIETEYAVIGFSNGVDVVIPGIIQILSMAHGSHYGVACKGKVMSVNGFEEIIDKFKKFVLQIGFVGIFDIDFYKSDNEFYFGELNLRIGGSCIAITQMGVNLPGMMVNFMSGEDFGRMKRKISGYATYVNERMLLGDLLQHYISLSTYLKMLKSAEIAFLKAKDDPKPYSVYQRRFWFLYAKSIVKQCLHFSCIKH